MSPVPSGAVKDMFAAHGTAPESSVGFRGRANELAALENARARAKHQVVAVQVVGPLGVGKTTLLQRFMDACTASNEHWLCVGPDPWNAGVVGYAIQETLRALLGTWQQTLDLSRAPQRVRATIGWALDHGAAGFERHPGARAHLVEALHWVIQAWYRRYPGRTLLWWIQDFDALDGASRAAILDFLAQPPTVGMLVLTDHGSRFDDMPPVFESIALKGLGIDALVGMDTRLRELSLVDFGADGALPMLVEQLAKYVAEGGTSPPMHVVDLIALRVARLKSDTRRVLQSVGVLGWCVSSDCLKELLGEELDLTSCLRDLVHRGMIQLDASGVKISHFLIRQVTEAITPVAVRRELHKQAYEACLKLKAPKEVRLLHALETQYPFDGLLLLDQVADKAVAWEDFEGAIQWYRRAVQVARDHADGDPTEQTSAAVVYFSNKLVDLLIQVGRYDEADAVLNEVWQSESPTSLEQAKLHFAAARLEVARGRLTRAMPRVTKAMALAYESGDAALLRTIETIARKWQNGE